MGVLVSPDLGNVSVDICLSAELRANKLLVPIGFDTC